jgi:CheY-like chemotaxis protein
MKETEMRDTSSTPPLRVLVVDDCKDNRESLEMLLLTWGHEVRLAIDGPSAQEAFRSFQPEAVLLDIGLPGMNGWEVARWMRQHGRCPGPLLVALTGYGREQDQAHSREAGFDAHLTKPADLADLQRLLTVPKGAVPLVGAA